MVGSVAGKQRPDRAGFGRYPAGTNRLAVRFPQRLELSPQRAQRVPDDASGVTQVERRRDGPHLGDQAGAGIAETQHNPSVVGHLVQVGEPAADQLVVHRRAVHPCFRVPAGPRGQYPDYGAVRIELHQTPFRNSLPTDQQACGAGDLHPRDPEAGEPLPQPQAEMVKVKILEQGQATRVTWESDRMSCQHLASRSKMPQIRPMPEQATASR